MAVSFYLFYYILDDYILRYIPVSLLSGVGFRIIAGFIIYIMLILIIDRKIKKIHIDALSVMYLALVIALSLFRYGHVNRLFVYNPLGIINDFKNNFDTTLILLVGNIFVYLPLGLYVKYRFKLSSIKLTALFLPYIITVEALQYITSRGVFDIDDIITNTAGFVFGGVCFGLLEKSSKRCQE